MQATAQQKLQILNSLYGYVAGQLSGAETETSDALDEGDEGDDGWRAEQDGSGFAQDAADILGVATGFAEHGDMDKMLQEVNGHDTLVREDVYEGLQDCGCWSVLEVLENNYYK